MAASAADVVSRLEGLGLAGISPSSASAALSRAEARILCFCNIASIPEALESVLIDWAAGGVILEGLHLGLLGGIAVSPAVVSVKEGDVSVGYSTSSKGAADRLESLAALLRDPSPLLPYRRIKWM